MPRAAALASFVAIAAVACGNSYGSDEALPAPDRDASSADGGGGGGDGGEPPGCASPTCSLPHAEAGFGLALYGARGDACPAGFTTSDVVTDVGDPTGPCLCAKCTTMGSSCNSGTLQTYYSNSPDCANSGAALDANGGACKDLPGSLAPNARTATPAPVVGTCSSAASADPATAASTPRRVCILDGGQCDDRMCAVPPSFAACLVHEGDVSCPAGMSKHLTGKSIDTKCAPCSCSLSVTCSGSLSFFGATGCSGAAVATIDTSCTVTGGPAFHSYKWNGVANESCATTPPTGPTKSVLVTPRTICCP